MLPGIGMPIGQKIDPEALQERRLAAGKLLDEGVTQAEVARRVEVSRQSVNRWAEAPAKELVDEVLRTCTPGGFRKSRHRGMERSHAAGQYVVAALNLLRLARLLVTDPPRWARA